MAIDTITVNLLETVLNPPSIRKVFTTIADMRIADIEKLGVNHPEITPVVLDTLEHADLIGKGASGRRYYVSARGLKVARNMGKLYATL